jgi:hypothetical protein
MWTYQGSVVDESSEVLDQYVGFVYLITNLTNNRQYIGKKLFRFKRTKKVKGKKKKITIASDWITYYGSNNELIEDVKVFGESSFKREILHLCKSKGVCNYLEMKEQIIRNVLESDDYYNEQIRARVHKSHLRLL